MAPQILPLSWDGLADASAAFLGYLALLFVMARVLPGKNQLGVKNSDGSQILYKLNGFATYLCVVAICVLGGYRGIFSLKFIYEHFFGLLIAANVFAFLGTFLLYFKGRAAGAPLRKGALGLVQDMFFGVELNPCILGVDLKMFSYRPSLLGLGLINVSFAVAQYDKYGTLSQGMVLYQVFYALYLANYFQFEYGMVFTWDIIAERFGWMLVWGDYVLVPFFYSLPGWYLLDRMEPLPTWEIVALSVLYTVGFCLFRGSNEQKHQFKQDPKARIWGKPAEAIAGKLLVSGFWGIGRKLNYTGELCIYWAWTLTTGTASVLPYLLPIWLLVLFTHRAWRDEQRCAEKYGPLWDEYCQRARFRMFPFIY
jgi:delta14-sterol reductase